MKKKSWQPSGNPGQSIELTALPAWQALQTHYETIRHLHRLGGDPVTVEAMRIEGSTDFSTDLIPPILPYDVMASHCCRNDGCGCCGVTGSILEYTPSGTEPGDAWFVVETRGPGESTIRVPIVLDHEGIYEHPRGPGEMWTTRDVSAVAVNPNPVKFT